MNLFARVLALVPTLVLALVFALLARSINADTADTQTSDATQPVLPLVERVLYSMPVGDDSVRCLRLPETECCSDPDAGIGAVVSNGDIWWYDLGNENIKIFSSAGTRVVRGFSGTPSDMAVNNSAVYLLFDYSLDPARFGVYARSHVDTSWHAVPFFFGPDGLPPDSVPVTVRNSSGGDVGQILAGADEMIDFYQRLAHESYPIARGDSLFSPADQVRFGFEGFADSVGRRYLSYGSVLYVTDDRGEEEYATSGRLIGVDASGHAYCTRPTGYETILELRDREKLIAEGVWARRGNWGGSGAKGSLHVRPQGGLIEFQPTAERLIISLWEPSRD